MTHVPIIIYDRDGSTPIGEYWPEHEPGDGVQEEKKAHMVLYMDTIIELYGINTNKGKE